MEIQKGWILSPVSDLIFVFGGSLVALLVLTLKALGTSFANDMSTATLFVITFALNGGHMVAGLFLLLSNRTERQRTEMIEPKIYVRCLIIILLCVVIFSISAILFSLSSESTAFKVPIWIAGLIYFLWNGWHFAMQQFGLLQVYRKRNDISTPTDRHLDRVHCLFFVFLIPSILLFSKGKNDEFFAGYFGTLEGLSSFRTEIFAVAFVMACLAIWRVSLQAHWKWPIALCYGGIFLIPVAMSFNPVIFLFLAVLGPHYLQEIFLITSIASSEEKDGQRSVVIKQFLIRFLVFLVASAVFYLILELVPHMGGQISIFGGVQTEKGLSSAGYWAVAGVAAAFAVFNFFHFYLDRLIFAKRANIP